MICLLLCFFSPVSSCGICVSHLFSFLSGWIIWCHPNKQFLIIRMFDTNKHKKIYRADKQQQHLYDFLLQYGVNRSTAPVNKSPCFFVCRQPPHCVPETYTNATSWYKVFTTVRDSDTKYSQDYNPFWCYKGAIGKVYHALNPKLTVIVPDVSHHTSSQFLNFNSNSLCFISFKYVKVKTNRLEVSVIYVLLVSFPHDLNK